ncbi:sigma-54 interaction domain-containing protein [Planctomicrobium sp. SH527]|uniref:sigma-54 interaction domain-containing protein n=1 Tax=Planctomicrobium sp. SH527 TaxID=3448123 RepID=UPI003F5B5A0A
MSIIFQSKAMLQVLERAKRFARSTVTILVQGESGTGKELLARLIHQQSRNAQAEYVRVNCAALSESLIESELFGHEAGAFTGAHQSRRGRFEIAANGTVFLDEIGELPFGVQAKLLRVLEEREFQRVGGNETIPMTGRVVAATNRDLANESERGNFRPDLYYRLNVLPLEIPALRERRDDIPALVNYFIQSSQSELERPVRGVTRPVMEQLCEYDWPGNVRELRNVILRCCILATSETIHSVELPAAPVKLHIPDTIQIPEDFDQLSLEEIERRVILKRLESCRGNKNEAAAALGVTARTLRNKVTNYRKLGYVG